MAATRAGQAVGRVNRRANRAFARTRLGRRLNRATAAQRRSRTGSWMGLVRPMPHRLTAAGTRVRRGNPVGTGSHRRPFGVATRPPTWTGRWARRRRVALALWRRSAAGRRAHGWWRQIRAAVATRIVATTRGQNLPNTAGQPPAGQPRTGQPATGTRMPVSAPGVMPMRVRPNTGATGTRRPVRAGRRRPNRIVSPAGRRRVAGTQAGTQAATSSAQQAPGGSTEGGTTMRGFRHTAPENAGNDGTGGAKVTPQPAWVTEFLDLLASASRQFTPENARAMVEVVEHYPALLHGMSQFARDITTRSAEAVEMPPSAAETLTSLAGIQERMAGAVETAMAAVHKILDWHIARASSGSSKVEAWDVRRWENAG